mgnify:CR=1 FL=1
MKGENMRIAVASSNGENVDLHFGKAKSLYVYEYDEEEDKFNFIDQRNVEIEVDMKHQNPKIIKAIEDCEVCICEQFGPKAAIYSEDAGLKLVKDEGTVEEVLRKYIGHVNFMKNIKIWIITRNKIFEYLIISYDSLFIK